MAERNSSNLWKDLTGRLFGSTNEGISNYLQKDYLALTLDEVEKSVNQSNIAVDKMLNLIDKEPLNNLYELNKTGTAPVYNLFKPMSEGGVKDIGDFGANVSDLTVGTVYGVWDKEETYLGIRMNGQLPDIQDAYKENLGRLKG